MKVSVLIPAFNAASTLSPLLRETLAYVPQENILLVDDGSFDTTASVAEAHGVYTIQLKKNCGKGAALQRGFSKILASDYDAVITMDADLQHEPKEIPNFIRRAEETCADVVIGNRLHQLRGMPVHRILSNVLTTFLVEARTGVRLRDSQCGFRFIKTEVLRSVQLSCSGFEAETEFLIKAALCGFRFDAIPISTIYAGEKSHMTHFNTTVQFLKVLLKEYQ
ncbi:MAG: glycosyltransferase family 2 protein [Bacteroidetes bacterium]|nr:glycosyltransferase family 2 protein [Bacteroidota bacterium]